MLVNSYCHNLDEGHFEELSKVNVFALNWVVDNIFVHCIVILYTLHIGIIINPL